MTGDYLSNRISELSSRIEALRIQCICNPQNAGEILMDALEELRINIEDLSVAETKLKESEQRFRDAIDHFPNVFVIYGSDRRMQFINSKGLQIIGLKELDMIGRLDEEIFPPEMINSYLPALKRAIETKTPQILERTRHVTMGGQTVIISITPLLDENGNIRQILGITYDVTERTRMEEELRKAQGELEQRVQERTAELSLANKKLEITNEALQKEIAQHELLVKELIKVKEAAEVAAEAKAEFMANMSHELRTPMNAVIGMTSLLLNDELEPEQMESIEIIRSSGEDLLALINKILDFSKIDRNKIELESQPFELQRCIEDSMDLLSGEAFNKNLSMAYKIGEDVPRIITSDPTRLRQILGNLLSNAVKFTDKGEVKVFVSSKAECVGHEIHFAIQDTGIGIPRDQMYKLFKPFSQVDASITRRYGGTGLGLSISKKLAETMGGRIWAESDPGIGSTFHFTILARPIDGISITSENIQSKSNLLSSLPSNLRILLAEDNEVNQKVMLKMLKHLGYRADLAANGIEAIQAIERQTYDIVFMDVKMPEMDGLEATKAICKLWSSDEKPKIVALTAYALEGDRERCLEAGMDDYISKPVKIVDLERILRNISQ